jgi:hypothetical protein
MDRYTLAAFRGKEKLGVPRKSYTLSFPVMHFAWSRSLVKKLCIDTKQKDAFHSVHPSTPMLFLVNLPVPETLVSKPASILRTTIDTSL